MKESILKHKKFLFILIGIIALNWHFGFDARFTIINILWILINVVKV
jgi:hypothetical protein